MPAAAKVSQSKKAGTSKTKGAVRAKSGCYTCRIRRKKCDESPNDQGHCRTCERLRLQCLGFGAKRPDWLRESRNVVDLREKIKSFLASQGMIKGHSGSGPRNADQDQPFLRLTEDPYHSSSSESPQSQTLSLSPDHDDLHRRHHHTSAMREQREPAFYAPAMEPYAHSGLHSTMNHARSSSPYSTSSSLEEYHPTYGMNNQSHSLVESSALIPSRKSSYSPLYHDLILFAEEDLLNGLMDLNDNELLPPFAYQPSGTFLLPNQLVNASVQAYVNNVINIQYLLGDQNVLPNMIWEAVNQHDVARQAVTLLARVYYGRQQQPQQIALTDHTNKTLLAQLQSELRKDKFDADDAMAALHVVSIFLFDGGKGAWNEFLALASRYVGNILRLPRYRGSRDALLHCNAKDAFIIKTVLWFDVLASVTLQRPPTTLSVIDEMFNPLRSGIEETLNPQYSMISPMGCENKVVWALAKTSALSCWKRDQIRRGALSVPELYRKAMEIDSHLERDPNQPYPLNSLDDRETSRTFAAEIFRTSTRLFLRTIVNGDYPHVKDVRQGVEDTFNSIKALGVDFNVYPSVVRSTVFGLYICGALTENLEHRETLRSYLSTGSMSEGVGNCITILQLLEEIWSKRNPKSTSPVDWLGPLAKADILLV